MASKPLSKQYQRQHQFGRVYVARITLPSHCLPIHDDQFLACTVFLQIGHCEPQHVTTTQARQQLEADVITSALDKYAFKLSTWLRTESTKPRKKKRKMHLDLHSFGYEGSYDRVAAFGRQWKLDQLERINLASKGTQITQNPRTA